MTDILLRVARRNTSFESSSVDDIVEVEFSREGDPDLALSVYRLDDDQQQIVRAYAEHYAAASLEPPIKSRRHIDLSENGVRGEPASVDLGFDFIRQRHHELQFGAAEELRAFVAKLLVDLARRIRRVGADEAGTYVKARLVDSDREWMAVIEAHEKWKRWAAKLTAL